MFVTESLLAFTIFRDEFDVPFLLMFGFLLFVKCFHWLMADRVESVRNSPSASRVVVIGPPSDGSNNLSWPPYTLSRADQRPFLRSMGGRHRNVRVRGGEYIDKWGWRYGLVRKRGACLHLRRSQ